MIALKNDREAAVDGNTLGGFVRAPYQSENEYGGFYFYAQHLVEMVSAVFGRYPRSVKAFSAGREKTVVFRYEKYDVTGIFTDHSFKYFAARFSEEGSQGGVVVGSDNWFTKEFADFDEIMKGGGQKISLDDFIAPVFIMRAIEKSLESGEEEIIEKFKV